MKRKYFFQQVFFSFFFQKMEENEEKIFLNQIFFIFFLVFLKNWKEMKRNIFLEKLVEKYIFSKKYSLPILFKKYEK